MSVEPEQSAEITTDESSGGADPRRIGIAMMAALGLVFTVGIFSETFSEDEPAPRAASTDSSYYTADSGSDNAAIAGDSSQSYTGDTEATFTPEIEYFAKTAWLFESDTEALSIGRAVCGDLDSGYTLVEVGSTLVTGGAGYSSMDAGTITGAAIYSFCPQHLPLVDPYR